MRIALLFFFSILSLRTLHAQQLTHVQGEILVQFKKNAQPGRWVEKHGLFRTQSTRIRLGPCLAEEMRIWKIRFDWTRIHEQDFLQQIRQDPAVEMAQLNHIAQLRSTFPNDGRFAEQWYLFNTGQSGGTQGMDLQMDLAWDITTGGVTPGRDTIVLCIIDNGLDTTHQDLRPNLWVNRGEIPNNNIDDDNNGYIDDYYGWNTIRNNNQISDANFHGTPVSGIAGARGNNGIGISGVNWNVKIMHVVGGFGAVSEDRILQAYLYPYRQRKRYNETQGREGAFVVATNASWGLSRIKPSEYPIWCAFYDSLGQQGIINIAATANEDLDVDAQGDMPTACGSNFLITVNSIDHRGLRAPGGFGVMSIDLGAFGENVLSTTPNNNYGLEKGTSFAAPQVTGAVGLMYAANCPTLSVLAENDPPAAALLVKSYILGGSTPTSSLAGRTVTGGRLNVFNSLRLLVENCGSCPPPSKINVSEIKQTSAKINWTVNDSIVRVDLRWRPAGTDTWNTLPNVSSPVALSALSACTVYEFQIKTLCRSDSIGFEQTYTFTTDGCCLPPTGIQIPFISTRDALVTWTAVTAATGYTVRHRVKGSNTWTVSQAYSNSTGLRNLAECTEYEFQIRSDCAGGTSSDYGPLFSFRSRGCGACLELNYCKASADSSSASQEWIARVKLNNFEHRSGKNGYGDFTGLSTTTLQAGNLYPIVLEPGFPGFSSQEYWMVWIDLNQDGIFSSQEVVFDSGQASRDSVSGIVSIPATAKTGPTRMRVVMRFRVAGSACSFSSDFFGEVEDYCLTISPVSSTKERELAAGIHFFPNPFSSTIRLQLELPGPQEWLQVEVWTLQGKLLYSEKQQRTPAGLIDMEIGRHDWPAGTYLLRIRSPQGVATRKIVKISA